MARTSAGYSSPPFPQIQKEEIIGFHASAVFLYLGPKVERECEVQRISAGLFQVKFFTPHPDGKLYEVLFGPYEDGELRDVPKLSVVKDTQTANGFRLQVTVDDNGGAADLLVDNRIFSFGVLTNKVVLVP